MSERCTAARDWLARQGVGQSEGESEAAAHAAHVAACPACSTVMQRYRAFEEACDVALDHLPAPQAAQRFVRAAGTSAPSVAELELRSAAEEALLHRPAPAAEHRLLEAARAQRASHPPRIALATGAAALAIAAALLLALLSWLDAPPPGRPSIELATVPEAAAGFVVQASGWVTVDGQRWDDASAMPAGAGRSLATGPEARFELSEGTDQITVGADSRLDITAWGPEHTALLLGAGTLEASVGPRPAEHPFEVITPQARVVVVGTRFTVVVTQQAGTVVRTLEGLVRVERGDGELLGLLSAGQELRVPGLEPASAEPVDLPTTSTPQPPPAQEAILRHSEPPSQESPAMEPLDQARAWLGEGQDDKAIALLQALPADDWERDALLGDAHRIGGQPDLAEEAYTRALERSTAPPAPLLAELAILQGERGRTREAGATWNRYLSAFPGGEEAPKAHLALGELALAELQQAEAERHLRAVLDQAPDSAQAVAALVLLARELFEQQRWDYAEALFAPLTERPTGPCVEPALVGLIRVRIAQDRTSEAAALIEHYRQHFPSGRRTHEVELLQQALGDR